MYEKVWARAEHRVKIQPHERVSKWMSVNVKLWVRDKHIKKKSFSKKKYVNIYIQIYAKVWAPAKLKTRS